MFGPNPMPYAAITSEALADQVARFYARARRDPELGPLFEVAVDDWPAHLEKLTDFWSSVMLTSGRYHGDPLAAHGKHPIEPAMFDRWLALWRETAEELFEPEPAGQLGAKAERIAESLKLGLFFRLPRAGADRGITFRPSRRRS